MKRNVRSAKVIDVLSTRMQVIIFSGRLVAALVPEFLANVCIN